MLHFFNNKILEKKSFNKKEKLTSKKSISELILKGKVIKTFPFYVRYNFIKNQTPEVKVLVSVSKRKFKNAVDRNRIKRQTREAYRLNKSEVWKIANDKNYKIEIFFDFINNKKIEFKNIHGAMSKLVKLICKKINSEE